MATQINITLKDERDWSILEEAKCERFFLGASGKLLFSERHGLSFICSAGKKYWELSREELLDVIKELASHLKDKCIILAETVTESPSFEGNYGCYLGGDTIRFRSCKTTPSITDIRDISDWISENEFILDSDDKQYISQYKTCAGLGELKREQKFSDEDPSEPLDYRSFPHCEFCVTRNYRKTGLDISEEE